MEKEKVTIELKDGRMCVLTLEPFNSEIETSDLLRIDYGNMMGEILTWPLIYHKISCLRAEMENIVSETKLDLDIFEANITEEHRKKLLGSGSKGTVSEVESAVKMDPRYLIKKKHYFSVQKNYNYIDALYWSSQSKDMKLNRLVDRLSPDLDKELIEGTINNVMIKFSKKVIN